MVLEYSVRHNANQIGYAIKVVKMINYNFFESIIT